MADVDGDEMDGFQNSGEDSDTEVHKESSNGKKSSSNP